MVSGKFLTSTSDQEDPSDSAVKHRLFIFRPRTASSTAAHLEQFGLNYQLFSFEIWRPFLHKRRNTFFIIGGVRAFVVLRSSRGQLLFPLFVMDALSAFLVFCQCYRW
jgi:hypothetical protein